MIAQSKVSHVLLAAACCAFLPCVGPCIAPGIPFYAGLALLFLVATFVLARYLDPFLGFRLVVVRVLAGLSLGFMLCAISIPGLVAKYCVRYAPGGELSEFADLEVQKDAIERADYWKAQVRVLAVSNRDETVLSPSPRPVMNACLTFADARSTSYLVIGQTLRVRIQSTSGPSKYSALPVLRAQILDVQPPSFLAGIRQKFLTSVSNALSPLSPDARGLCLALLLGRQDALGDDEAALFYDHGCAQLVALSGMHIAMVGALVLKLAVPLVGRRRARIVGTLAATFFVFLVGPMPSALRALGMFAYLQVMSVLGRRARICSALCVSVIVSDLVDPGLLADTGYILSCVSLAGILWGERPLVRLLRRPLRPVPATLLSASLAAQIVTAPVLALRGLLVKPEALVYGLVLGPITLALLAVSACLTLAALLPLVGPWLVALAGFLIELLMKVLVIIEGLSALW